MPLKKKRWECQKLWIVVVDRKLNCTVSGQIIISGVPNLKRVIRRSANNFRAYIQRANRPLWNITNGRPNDDKSSSGYIPLRLIIDHYDGCLMILRGNANTNDRDSHITSVLFSLELDEMSKYWNSILNNLRLDSNLAHTSVYFVSCLAQRFTIDLRDCQTC